MTEPAKLTEQQIWDKKNEFDFEKLLDPYREGGTETKPVRRTMGTLIDWLLNKKKYPIDVVGAALLKVFLELHQGKRFEGDGTYGSPGHELCLGLRTVCDEMNKVTVQNKMYQWMAQNVFMSVAKWAAEETKRQMKPWWKRIFSKKPAIKVEDLDVSA